MNPSEIFVLRPWSKAVKRGEGRRNDRPASIKWTLHFLAYLLSTEFLRVVATVHSAENSVHIPKRYDRLPHVPEPQVAPEFFILKLPHVAQFDILFLITPVLDFLNYACPPPQIRQYIFSVNRWNF